MSTLQHFNRSHSSTTMQILPIFILSCLVLAWQIQARSLSATVKNCEYFMNCKNVFFNFQLLFKRFSFHVSDILGIRSAVLDHSEMKMEEMNVTFWFFHRENESVPLNLNVTKNILTSTYFGTGTTFSSLTGMSS